jgi:hypothetical protein
LQDLVKFGWPPLFTPPPMPAHTPQVVFEQIAQAIEGRFGQTAAAVQKIRARGGKVVFVRFLWTRLIKESGAPGIYYSDHPELVFDCPEWSHLSAADATEFSKRLVPHLQKALGE